MFCMQCGAKLRDDARFCSACGAPVVAAGGASAGESATADEANGAESVPVAEAAEPVAPTPAADPVSEPVVVGGAAKTFVAVPSAAKPVGDGDAVGDDDAPEAAGASDSVLDPALPTLVIPPAVASEPDLVSQLLGRSESKSEFKPESETCQSPEQEPVSDRQATPEPQSAPEPQLESESVVAYEPQPALAPVATPEPQPIPDVPQETALFPASAPAAEPEAPSAPSPYATDDEPREPKKRLGAGAKVAIGIAVAAVLAAGGGAGYYFGIYKPEQEHLAQEAYDAAHSLHAVTISVKAEGWDTADGATRLPVHIEGTDLDGNDIDALKFVDSDGEGISLVQGSYKLTVPASPIASDGTVYDVPDATVEVTIDSDAKKDQSYDISTDHGFELTPTDPAKVTDDQVNDAYDYASKDKDQDSSALDNLKDAAIAKREKAAAAAARHVVVKGGEYAYEFDLPAVWDGRVKVEQDGKGNVTVRPINDPDHAVFSMFVVSEDMVSWGDAGNPFNSTFADPFGNKMVAGVDVTNWGNAEAATEWANDGHADEISDFEYQFYEKYPPMKVDALNEIISLQSGGKLDFEDFQGAVNGKGGLNDLSKSAHEYIKQTIVPTIKLVS